MASLVIIEGKQQGSCFVLSEPLVSLGRDDVCTFQILDEQVSRTHLQVRLNPTTGGHVAADYRSANGVFVNGDQIIMPTALKDGDKIRIGQTTLMYLSSDHPDAQSAMTAAKKKGEWKRVTLENH
jgi:pSer/pThr/pTyr-binding forkhead associated (FHA) protein